MRSHLATTLLVAALLLATTGCPKGTPGNTTDAGTTEPLTATPDGTKPPTSTPGDKAADSFDQALLVGMAQFITGDDGKPKPGPARLEIFTRKGGAWSVERVEDPDSDVFHKAMAYTMPDGTRGILTIGATRAIVKFWTRGADGKLSAKTLWEKSWGGKRDRMRDVEVGDLFGDGSKALAIATHDQGVVATLRPKKDGTFEIKEMDQRPSIFVHEIELGDLNGDKKLEFYATPSEPNKLEADAQHGEVVRYDPVSGARAVVADLGDRHAKEIWVGDVDGDGKDELYVAVEAKTKQEGDKTIIEQPVEIRRYEGDTDPKAGFTVATLDDRFCRFLTVGDVDGDGKKELIAAPFKSGIWLLRPSSKPTAELWKKEQIEADSSGFEHAAILLDLDGDKKDELYVASDQQKELRVYRWTGAGFQKEVLLKRPDDDRFITWNLMPAPLSHIK